MNSIFDRSKWWLAVVAMALGLVISLSLIASPNVEAWETLASVGLIFFVAVILLAAPVWGWPQRMIWVPIIAGILAIPFVTVAQIFGPVDIFTILFRARFGVAQTLIVDYGREIAIAFLAVGGVVFAVFGLGNLLNWKRTIYLIGTAMLVLCNPLTRYAVQYATASEVQSSLHDQIDPPQVLSPQVLPDIIIVYLEGLEQAYADPAQFGNIAAPLQSYRDRGVSFSDVAQVRGTGWSLAGFVASQCGVPVVADNIDETYAAQEVAGFMPALTCLGDVTSQKGYNNIFVLGGVVDFGGFDQFLATHGYPNFVDRNVIEGLYPADTIRAAQTGWILDDQIVFDAAKGVYDDLSSQDAPMLIAVETYGPHGATAILSRNCTQDGQARLDPDIPASIVCLLANAQDFVTHVENNRGDRPTLVVLASDHLNHDFQMNRIVAADARRNTVIMMGLGLDAKTVTAGATVEKAGSMLDIYPTILAASGLAGPNAQGGLGRSLLGSMPTLIEDKGIARLNAELFPNPLLSEIIWRAQPE